MIKFNSLNNQPVNGTSFNINGTSSLTNTTLSNLTDTNSTASVDALSKSEPKSIIFWIIIGISPVFLLVLLVLIAFIIAKKKNIEFVSALMMIFCCNCSALPPSVAPKEDNEDPVE